MKKIATIIMISLIAMAAVVAAPRFGIGLGLGFTPSVSTTVSFDRLDVDAEATLIGAHAAVTYDVLNAEHHSLHIGAGVGGTFNPIINVFAALFSLGHAGDIINLSADLQVKYTWKINEHNGIFVETGMPIVSANWNNQENRIENPIFSFSNLENLKTAGGLAVLMNTRIGYRYKF